LQPCCELELFFQYRFQYSVDSGYVFVWNVLLWSMVKGFGSFNSCESLWQKSIDIGLGLVEAANKVLF